MAEDMDFEPGLEVEEAETSKMGEDIPPAPGERGKKATCCVQNKYFILVICTVLEGVNSLGPRFDVRAFEIAARFVVRIHIVSGTLLSLCSLATRLYW